MRRAGRAEAARAGPGDENLELGDRDGDRAGRRRVAHAGGYVEGVHLVEVAHAPPARPRPIGGGPPPQKHVKRQGQGHRLGRQRPRRDHRHRTDRPRSSCTSRSSTRPAIDPLAQERTGAHGGEQEQRSRGRVVVRQRYLQAPAGEREHPGRRARVVEDEITNRGDGTQEVVALKQAISELKALRAEDPARSLALPLLVPRRSRFEPSRWPISA